MALAVGMTDTSAVTAGSILVHGARDQIQAMMEMSKAANGALMPSGGDAASLEALNQQKDGFAAYAAIMDDGLMKLEAAAAHIQAASDATTAGDAASSLAFA